MSTPWPTISVIICAYTEERWSPLVAAVESVQRQSVAPLEIIIVVDHNPSLWERARAAFPDVNVVPNREARGLSGARNTGLAVVRGEVVAFMDEDAVADAGWLLHLVQPYTDPQVLGVGGVIEPLWAAGRPRWFPHEFDWVVGCTYRGMPRTTTSVRNLIGCNMSFRREVFTTVGGFRDGIGRVGTHPVGCEETELCIRAKQHWPTRVLLYEPQARVQHRVPASRATWRYFRARCYAEGLSKALVAQFVGSRDGLASERTYTLKTLPQGVLRGVADLLGHADRFGVARAVAIVAGLATTTMGYLAGLRARRSRGLSQRSASNVPHNSGVL